MRTIAQKSYISWLMFFTISVVIFLSSCDNNIFDNKPFNQKAWIENPWSKDKNVRIEMSEDLLVNHLKIGMTRQQVRKLLGEPDSVDSYNNYDYYLGEYTFLIGFDRVGKLVKKEIVSI